MTTHTDHWNAAGKAALDEQGRRAFDDGFQAPKASELFWRVENFDRGLSMEALGNASDHHLAHAEQTLHHWLELIRSEQRKRR